MTTPPQHLALRGVGVLVTRPEGQAAPLCRRLESAGAFALHFPVIELQPVEHREAAGVLGASGRFDVIVLVSSNAVRFGARLLEQVDRDHHSRLAAIGPATARALESAGRRAAIQPNAPFDSEALLQHPDLRHPAGLRILIVKGRGGRALLEQALRDRGASVDTLDVYQRLPANPGPAARSALAAHLQAGKLHVVTATSLEIATRLLEIADAPLRESLGRLHWLAVGARIAEGIRDLGVAAPLIEAASADDQALVSALAAWRAAESGA